MLVFEKLSIRSKSFFLTIYSFANIILLTSNTFATELGITPNHVFNIWQNIGLASEMLFQETYGVSLSKTALVKPRRFMGKTSNDVMEKALRLHKDLALIVQITHTQPEPYWVREYKSFEKNTSTHTKPQTVSDVYILSSHILQNIVNKYVEVTKGTKSVRHFYLENQLPPKDKTLDDVYAELDLLSAKLKYVSSNPLSMASGE
ncbi:hypothetical protein [Curvivirga sp.]|uniref:hypothetical protein n=1 Tax=Curvivirga sp. TaxID=2856848 RepID=UPI003B59C07E